MKQHVLLAVTAMVIGGATFAACSSTSANLIGPSNQLQVTDTTNNYQFQVSALSGVTQTLKYNWLNTSDSASVNQASTLTAGSAMLTILDSTGTQLYQASLVNNGTFKTLAGHAGTWQIQVVLSGASGTLNFRVQKI